MRILNCWIMSYLELYEDVIIANRTENSERRMLKLTKLLHELSDHNFETFRFLAQHLNKVTTREEVNKVVLVDVKIMNCIESWPSIV